MKIKKLIKLTPLFNSVAQSIVITAVILLVITINEIWPIIIAVPIAVGYLFLQHQDYSSVMSAMMKVFTEFVNIGLLRKRFQILIRILYKQGLCHHSFFCFGKERFIHLFYIKKTMSYICVIMLLDLRRMPMRRLRI